MNSIGSSSTRLAGDWKRFMSHCRSSDQFSSRCWRPAVKPYLRILPLIFHTARAFRLRVDHELAPLGITGQQTMVLVSSLEEGMKLSTLASALGIDNAALTRLVDRLEAKDLAVRQPDTSDRRSLTVHPTQAGRILAQRLIPKVQEMEEAILEDFRKEEIDQLNELLARLLSKLEPDNPFLSLCGQ